MADATVTFAHSAGGELGAGDHERIRRMAWFFLQVFRDEHLVDKVGAAESILATLLCDNARTRADALAGVAGVADDIRDTINRSEWP